jgi:tyrosyl-tRNA synthetase
MPDSNKINLVLDRGVEKIFPNRGSLETVLLQDKPIRVYSGIDPTGKMHLGHAIQLRKLGQFQAMGHNTIVLIGDFTALIGDPTDKTSTRIPLSQDQVLENMEGYIKHIGKILDLHGHNPAQILYNSAWLGEMRFEKILDVLSKMTVEQMIKRDMFQERIKADKPIFLHEFLYPLMQGYDSVAMDVDVEVGATDQTFNMLVGRDLLKQYKNKEKFVITTKLLVDSSGRKMSKSEGNVVWLDDPSFEMYGKIMSWSDEQIIPALTSLTDVSQEEIDNIEREITNGELNPKDAKMRLGRDIVEQYHGAECAIKAESDFINTFSKREMWKDAQVLEAHSGVLLVDLLIDADIVLSRMQYRRLLSAGAISDEQGVKIEDYDYKVTETTTFKIGKKQFVRAVVIK